jgi:hypothetical protein
MYAIYNIIKAVSLAHERKGFALMITPVHSFILLHKKGGLA